jgi:hypothetical protein
MTTEAAISAGPIGRAEESRQSAAGIFLPWIACVALMAVTGLFIHFVGAGLETDPRKDMFGVTGIAVFGLLGGLGVFLASRTGFPAAWDARIGNRVRFVYPLALGAGLGVVSVVLELLTGGIAFVLDDLDRDVFNAPLPGSVLLYSAGAVVLEVVYRLLPIPVVMWVAQRFGFPERHRLKLFWVLAVLTSLLEPSGQTAIAIDAGRYDLAISQFALGFGYNLAQAYWFLRAGFLASLSVRWGHYAIWHVIYGGLICAC